MFLISIALILVGAALVAVGLFAAYVLVKAFISLA